MSARHRGPRPPPPPPSSPLTVTSHNPERRGGGECPAPRSPPALHPIVFPPQCTPTHSSPPLLPLPPQVMPPCPRPPPLTHTHTHPGALGTGVEGCVGIRRQTPLLSSPSCHPTTQDPHCRCWILHLPPFPSPLFPSGWSSGDKLLRQCLIHRQLNQLRALRGGRRTNRLPPTLPAPLPLRGVGWRVGKGEVRGQQPRSACLLFPLPLPLPVSFPHLQPPTGDRRRLVFSERRELALSLVSCLLPSSGPSLLLAPTTLPPSTSSWETCRHTLQSGDLPGPELWPGFALPRPASPCHASTWGAWSWKERLFRAPRPEMWGEETASLPLGPPWHQTLSCRGLARLTWPGLRATPMSGHLSREGQ